MRNYVTLPSASVCLSKASSNSKMRPRRNSTAFALSSICSRRLTTSRAVPNSMAIFSCVILITGRECSDSVDKRDKPIEGRLEEILPRLWILLYPVPGFNGRNYHRFECLVFLNIVLSPYVHLDTCPGHCLLRQLYSCAQKPVTRTHRRGPKHIDFAKKLVNHVDAAVLIDREAGRQQEFGGSQRLRSIADKQQ